MGGGGQTQAALRLEQRGEKKAYDYSSIISNAQQSRQSVQTFVAFWH